MARTMNLESEMEPQMNAAGDGRELGRKSKVEGVAESKRLRRPWISGARSAPNSFDFRPSTFDPLVYFGLLAYPRS